MAATETTRPEATRDPARPLPKRAWWHRHLEPEERRRVMTDLAVIRVDNWASRFVIMLTLSVIVAVMGLSLDSAAVVIGAMLLAPLMQPVLAAGASLSMALFTKSMISLGKVGAATAWCIGIAYVISLLVPESELTSEVLARTQPDIKDLVVALAAGAGGAYATVRADASSSLPGVAVAVALVPPLGSVGIALEAGETELAVGALLLYFTNLAAIVFASIVVFVFTGFVPPRRLSDNLLRLTLTSVALVAVVIIVAVPLYQASVESIERNTEQRTAEDIVSNWLEERRLDRSVTINRSAQQVVVELRGLEAPPDQGSLVADMQVAFPGYDVPVQYIQTLQATTTTVPPPEPTEQLLARIGDAVTEWFEESGTPHQIDDIALNGNLVRIDAAGTGEPPDIDDLLPRLLAIDETLSPGLNWVTLETFVEEPEPSPAEVTAQDMSVVVDRWAAERDLIVRTLDYDGERVVIEVLGANRPDIARLELDLQQIADAPLPVNVYFTPRELVTTTAPPTPPVQTR